MNVREWALPVYTILMQLAVGALLVLWVIRARLRSHFSPEQLASIIRNPLLVISLTVIVAMIGAHFHLSRPFYSFYAIRNFRTSWLSREIAFTVLLFIFLGSTLWLSRYRSNKHNLIGLLGSMAVLVGLVVVYCMARIYLLPTQLAWNSPVVILSFYGTTLLLGLAAIACLLVLDLKFSEIQQGVDLKLQSLLINSTVERLVWAIFLAALFEIGMALFQLQQLTRGDPTLQTALQLLVELYLPLYIGRLLLLLCIPLWMAYSILRIRRSSTASQDLIMPVYLSCLVLLIAEIIGRFLFYATHIRVGI